MKPEMKKLRLKKEVVANLSISNNVKGGTFADTYMECVSGAPCETKPYYTVKACHDSLVGCNTQTQVFNCDPLSQGCPIPKTDACNPTGGGVTHYCATNACETNTCACISGVNSVCFCLQEQ